MLRLQKSVKKHKISHMIEEDYFNQLAETYQFEVLLKLSQKSMSAFQYIKSKKEYLKKLANQQPPNHIDKLGNKYWLDLNGLLHRYFDLPAYIGKPYPADVNDVVKYWGRDGLLSLTSIQDSLEVQSHRFSDTGIMELWCQHGVVQRERDKPAEIQDNGRIQKWYDNSLLHRGGDKPAVVSSNGIKIWYFKGLIHRAGGKHAVESLTSSEYWFNGKLHRINGPAIVYHINDPNIKDEWWVNGVPQQTPITKAKNNSNKSLKMG